MAISQAAIDTAREYERLSAGWDEPSDSFAVYLVPTYLTEEPSAPVEAGFRTLSDASEAVHRIRAERIVAAARGLEAD